MTLLTLVPPLLHEDVGQLRHLPMGSLAYPMAHITLFFVFYWGDSVLIVEEPPNYQTNPKSSLWTLPTTVLTGTINKDNIAHHLWDGEQTVWWVDEHRAGGPEKIHWLPLKAEDQPNDVHHLYFLRGVVICPLLPTRPPHFFHTLQAQLVTLSRLVQVPPTQLTIPNDVSRFVAHTLEAA